MINFLFFICLISIIIVTHWIISKIILLNKSAKNLTLKIDILRKNLSETLKKTKNSLKPKQKIKKWGLTKMEVFLTVSDTIFTLAYKRKYERLKDYYEFIKNTLA